MKKFAGWLKRLNKPERILLVVAVLILLALATSSGQDQKNLNVAPASDKSHAKSESKPKITTKTVTETQDIAFGSTTVDDSNLAKGKTEIRTQGVNGTRTLTYKLTYENGEQTKKELISNDVTQQPVTQVTAVGTYVAQQQAQKPNCDPNYTGACVPNVYPSDVDCAGGSGNGPYYVQGPVYVVGTDHYGLDGNGDRVGCQ